MTKKKNGCIRSFQTFFLYSRNRRVKLASELKEPIKPPVKENWSPCGLCIREAAVLALIRDLIYLECLVELHSSARTSVSLKVFQSKAGWTCAVVVSSLEIWFILSVHSAWINITADVEDCLVGYLQISFLIDIPPMEELVSFSNYVSESDIPSSAELMVILVLIFIITLRCLFLLVRELGCNLLHIRNLVLNKFAS